ncbi:Hypothetical predicted protein, partial [Marmota monax]
YEINDALYLPEPEPRPNISRLLSSHPVSLPQQFTAARLTECVRTRSPSASERGSGIWWSYTEGSPDRPWCLLYLLTLPTLLWTPTPQEPHRPVAKWVPTNRHLAGTVPSRKSTG